MVYKVFIKGLMLINQPNRIMVCKLFFLYIYIYIPDRIVQMVIIH